MMLSLLLILSHQTELSVFLIDQTQLIVMKLITLKIRTLKDPQRDSTNHSV